MDEDLIGTKIPVWGVVRVDPGFIYVIEDRGRYKIGKSKRTAERVKAATTWLPDMVLIGCKPFWNMSRVERDLHAGFALAWYSGEWFGFELESDREIFLSGFTAFSDVDRDKNSVNFIYWMNGDGMAEYAQAKKEQGLSLPKFLRQEAEKPKR
jgi:hypothetical protein